MMAGMIWITNGANGKPLCRKLAPAASIANVFSHRTTNPSR
jgi:hypothetical protein